MARLPTDDNASAARVRPFVVVARALGLIAALGAATVGAAPQEVPVNEEAALYAAPTRLDRVGRILAAVEINGGGPYRFILDTGANRSVISADLADELGLVSDTAGIEVHGVTGSALVPAARITQMRAGDISMADQVLPILTGPVFANARGILGVDRLQGARIEVDFGRDTVVIRGSSGRRAREGYLTVPARLRHGGLLLVAGKVGTVRAKVIIDTGAEHTIGNVALQEALARKSRGSDSSVAIVTGATPGSLAAVTSMTPTISIGEARLRNLPVTFGDLHVFSIWGLDAEPALVVGMDILGTLESFVVDYPRNEFQLKPWDRLGPAVEMCNSSGGCGSRLPRPRR